MKMLFQTKVGEAWQVGNCLDEAEHIVWPRESTLIQAVAFSASHKCKVSLCLEEKTKRLRKTLSTSQSTKPARGTCLLISLATCNTFPWSLFAIKFWTSVNKKLSACLLNTLKMRSILQSIEWKQFRNTNASRFISGRNKPVLWSVNWS